ncbi:MAG: sigma-70 family RNA polymerase sigma factor [Chthoniobacteraceae bacterium]
MNHDPNFAQTRWSLIQRVQAGGDAAAVALGELCAAYWFPLYGWARRSGASPEDAEDVVQGFFSDVLRKHLFEKADATKGRLRTFLLTAFRRYQRDAYEKTTALRRDADRTVSFDAMAGEQWYRAEPGTATPDAFYDRQWALTVLEQAIARLGGEYAKRGKAADFQQLRRYLTDPGDAGYEQDATMLGISPGAVKVAVHRLRERFRAALREEVASKQFESEDVDEELAHLLWALEA